MNSMNTLLLSLELGEKALVGYTFVKSDSYAFNVSAFLNAINDAKSLKFEFKAGLLTITTNNSEAILPTIKLRRSEEQKLDFNANFDISPYLHLFKECRIKAKSIFPIQLEGDIGEGMMLKVVASPTISATRLGNYEYPANI
ncbi:hypothetical protein HYV85_02805 [Candidatus Woesearchaeota archaeon]|nr:hypothetical protein [Candidatus Woesearchaeota archaeon]